jgi:peptidoglycan-associated lipoprotein
VTAQCDPCTVEVGGTSRLSAQATDPDGDPVTYRWTAPGGTFAPADAANSTWTAPTQPGQVVATVTASDGRGGQATSNVTIQVIQRVVIEFEDVYFAFDRFNLSPEALEILNRAVTTLQANPAINVTIEGHTDSVGTTEYNLALGERRAGSVRDYLISRTIAAGRLRTVSFGEDRPIATNDTAEGRAQNRRAHIVVVLQ